MPETSTHLILPLTLRRGIAANRSPAVSRIYFMQDFLQTLTKAQILTVAFGRYLGFIPASNEPSGCLQTFGDCREGQIPRCSAALQV